MGILNKIIITLKEHLEVIPYIYLFVVFMGIMYFAMLIGCASDDSCYDLHMNPIMEVPYVNTQK